MAGISEFSAKIMIKYADKNIFWVLVKPCISQWYIGVLKVQGYIIKNIFFSNSKVAFFCIEDNFLIITLIFRCFSL